jgi:hypothetical protein
VPCVRRGVNFAVEPTKVLYDNACKLRSVALAKKNLRGDVTRLLAETSFLLDRFHRNNHVWCLTHVPEVDPERPENADLKAGVNSQVAEEYFSWMDSRALAAREMTFARNNLYWWSLFHERNSWLDVQNQAARRRYARGHVSKNPDIPQTSSKRRCFERPLREAKQDG